MPAPPPLSELRVVTLEQAVAAPFCSRQLADMGADVVKVERPDGGDFARSYDGALHGLSGYFAWLNRGKRSVTLDLKAERGREAMDKLLMRSDVFIHNLAPGAIDRLGFGWEELRQRNPGLLWVSISGYGLDGPYRDKKAYDMLIQAESGVVALTGTPEEPAKVGISIADISAGLYAFAATLSALMRRGHTGEGDRIDVSIMECLTEWVMPPLYTYLGTGQAPPRAGLRHNMIVPYGAYPCSDGAVMLAIQNEREWARFCRGVLRRPELADDERFAGNERRLYNREALEAIIEASLSDLSRAEVVSRLDEAGIANGAVNEISHVAEHPQLKARQRWTTVESPIGPIPALYPPYNLQGMSPNMGRVPARGEHTREVLSELGLSEATSWS